MQTNKTAAALVSLLAEDRSAIPYRPGLREITGSVTSAILLSQFVHRAARRNFEPFYKFIQPCRHDLCRPGDTWVEETGFSYREFTSAVKRIGTKITPSAAAETVLPEDPAQRLVLYWTDAERVTWWFLNVNDLATLLADRYLIAHSAISDDLIALSASGSLELIAESAIRRAELIAESAITYRGAVSPLIKEKEQSNARAPGLAGVLDHLQSQLPLLPPGSQEALPDVNPQPQSSSMHTIGSSGTAYDPATGLVPAGTGRCVVSIYHEFQPITDTGSAVTGLRRDEWQAMVGDRLDDWRAVCRAVWSKYETVRVWDIYAQWFTDGIPAGKKTTKGRKNAISQEPDRPDNGALADLDRAWARGQYAGTEEEYVAERAGLVAAAG